MKFSKNIFLFFIISGSILLQSCASYMAPIKTTPARLGPKSEIYDELTSLPVPKEKIVTAVYKFRDQTGQYKPSSTGANWSTAVTQGATSILLKALEESGWFIPIEREGLSNLLNERKIIRSSRSNYGEAEDQLPPIPPLLYAGIILEGGIISYDSNILTGGAGLQYFGAGASGQYREDRVSIYLRAISTQSGRILKTVYTTKTILSQMVDVNLFRFVKFKRLLEAETGFSYNEPVEMCVTEAIEKAVQSLVIEGLFDKLWELENPEDMNSPVIKNYIREKEENKNSDYFGRLLTDRGEFSFGLNFGGQYYFGDYANSLIKPAGEVYLKKSVSPGLSLSLNLGRGQFAVKKGFFESTLDHASIQGTYQLLPENTFTPYVYLGLGVLLEDKGILKLSNNCWSYVESGFGFEFLLNKNIGFNLMFSSNYLLKDDLDGVENGSLNDYYWGSKIGLSYYFNAIGF